MNPPRRSEFHTFEAQLVEEPRLGSLIEAGWRNGGERVGDTWLLTPALAAMVVARLQELITEVEAKG